MKVPGNLMLIAATTLALCAHAQTSKPGLWEVTSKMVGNPEIEKAMADMQKQLASMPAGERKQMEAMMGKQGLSMAGPAGAMVMKSCITKEMVEQSQLPVQTQGNCTSTTSEKTATSAKFKYVCTNPAANGEGQFSFPNDSTYTLKMKLTSAVQGRPQVTMMEGSGKWLGTDCGTIKPLAMPKAASAGKP